MDLKTWMYNLASAFSKRPSDRTLEIYVEKLSRWSLTEIEWQRAFDRITGELESWPSLAQIYPYLRMASMGPVEQIPTWRTWRDLMGHTYAQKLGHQDASPGPQVIERWRQETCSLDEGREAFRQGYLEAGSDLAMHDKYLRALCGPEEQKAADERHRRLQHMVYEEVPF